MDTQTRAAFSRLIALAKSDTGQAKRAASFILAWWNAQAQGGFDIADLFSVDRRVARDMATVFNYVASLDTAEYPDDSFEADIEAIILRWRQPQAN